MLEGGTRRRDPKESLPPSVSGVTPDSTPGALRPRLWPCQRLGASRPRTASLSSSDAFLTLVEASTLARHVRRWELTPGSSVGVGGEGADPTQPSQGWLSEAEPGRMRSASV